MSPKIIPVLLSIDGGSSTLKYGLISVGGLVFKEMTLPSPFNLSSFKDLSFEKSLSKILNKLPKKYSVSYAVLGVSGLDTPVDYSLVYKNTHTFFKRNYPHLVDRFYICGDIELVLNLSSRKNAIALVSGTGSNCIGRNNKGKFSKAGGLDYLLADQGSGYYIGLKALRLAIKTLDGRGNAHELTRAILAYLKLKNAYEIKDYLYYKNKDLKKTIASLTFPVVRLFQTKKDPMTESLLKKSSYELFLHVKAVANSLGFSKEDSFEVVATGSIISIRYIKTSLEKHILDEYPRSLVAFPKAPSFYGGFFYAKSKGLFCQ